MTALFPQEHLSEQEQMDSAPKESDIYYVWRQLFKVDFVIICNLYSVIMFDVYVKLGQNSKMCVEHM